jgi:hypothetical protein
MRRGRTLILIGLVAAVLGFYGVVMAQGPKTYTCSWSNDGVGVDYYQILVDATVTVDSIPASACTGTGSGRTCSSPLTMTTGISHSVVVKAVNIFGSVSSSPFGAAPPSGAVAGVTVK